MKQLLILSLFVFSFRLGITQKLIKDEVDEFTKHKVKETSFEPIVENFTMSCYLSVKKIDSVKYLQVIINVGTGVSHFIEKGASFYLKLSNDSIIELKSIEYAISCKGCANTGRFVGSQSEGSRTTYVLSDEEAESLQDSNLKKIRIYTSKGYIETDIKEQKGSILKNELKLIN